MIDTLTGLVEKSWAHPYKIAMSLLGLLLIFGGLEAPLATASDLLALLSADTWSDALTSANTWVLDHRLPYGDQIGLLGMAVAAFLAAGQMVNPPTRVASTFWLFVAIAVYSGAPLSSMILWVLIGLFVRFIFDVVRMNFDDAIKRAALALADLGFGAFGLPIGIVLWIFMPRGGATQAKPE